jgi:hypothetical protein
VDILENPTFRFRACNKLQTTPRNVKGHFVLLGHF